MWKSIRIWRWSWQYNGHQKKYDWILVKWPRCNTSETYRKFFWQSWELKKSCPQGYDKSTSDLVIKYSKDLIDGKHEWCTRTNRNVVKNLEIKKKKFEEKQRELIKTGVDNLDTTNICSDNKLIKCAADCKKSHNRPIIDADGLEMLTKDLSSDEMTLHKALNLEIRFRKLSLTNVKYTSPLFRQRGLWIDEEKRKLKTLISS